MPIATSLEQLRVTEFRKRGTRGDERGIEQHVLHGIRRAIERLLDAKVHESRPYVVS